MDALSVYSQFQAGATKKVCGNEKELVVCSVVSLDLSGRLYEHYLAYSHKKASA